MLAKSSIQAFRTNAWSLVKTINLCALCLQVHLDHKHMGLGGDDSWSPSVHENFLVQPIPYKFSMSFCPLTSDSQLNWKQSELDWL